MNDLLRQPLTAICLSLVAFGGASGLTEQMARLSIRPLPARLPVITVHRGQRETGSTSEASAPPPAGSLSNQH